MRPRDRGLSLLCLAFVGLAFAGCGSSALPADTGSPHPTSASHPADSPSPPGLDLPADADVAGVLLDADLSIPDVYIGATADPDGLRVTINGSSSRAAEFRSFVGARVADNVQIQWETVDYAPSDRVALGAAILDEARAAGLEPSGGQLDRTGDPWVFELYVREIANVEFAKHYLGGHEVLVRQVTAPTDGLE